MCGFYTVNHQQMVYLYIYTRSIEYYFRVYYMMA